MTRTQLKEALCDRFTTAELVDFLDIDVSEFIERFEDEVFDDATFEDLMDYAGLRGAD